MTTTRKNNPASENTEKMWDVLTEYLNDADGLTRYDIIELADFNMSEHRTRDEIFDRTMKVCKKRAEKKGMFIPRATPGRGGYTYVLTDQAERAMDGYIAQEGVAAGTRRSAHRHSKFIGDKRESMPPTLRVVFDQMAEISDEREQFMQDQLDRRRDDAKKVMAAWHEEHSEDQETV